MARHDSKKLLPTAAAAPARALVIVRQAPPLTKEPVQQQKTLLKSAFVTSLHSYCDLLDREIALLLDL
jgi:hypothetical protein